MIKKSTVFIGILLVVYPSSFGAVIQNKDLGVFQKTSVLATPIPVTEPSPIILASPGCYKLIANTVDKQIIINSDDVALLLNGFSLNNPTLDDDAIIVNSGHSDIIIQGGEVSGNNFSGRAGVRVNDDCTNILINLLKIRNEYYGAWCVTGTSSTNVLIRENVISNCDFGITASDTIGLKIKQNIISSPNYAPAGGTTAIFLENATGTSIDYNHIIYVQDGIQTNSCYATSITNCILERLTGPETIHRGIYLSNGLSSMVENCIVNSMNALTSGDMFGIVLDNEQASCINNCLVSFMYPTGIISLHAVGIQVRRTIAATDFCIVQDNVVSNIFGNDLTTTNYGYELFDTTATPTLDNFINNKAIHCFAPVVPYSANIIDTANGPQATQYLWNWIIP